MRVQVRSASGSSPLARGLRRCTQSLTRTPRIIPARAGFTPDDLPGPAGHRDHPRSRGVYPIRSGAIEEISGSFPLARGLLSVRSSLVFALRIIPARAGFTKADTIVKDGAVDHPRSRGVYRTTCTSVSEPAGSSPLARGLLVAAGAPAAGYRIIPARAGFTRSPPRPRPPPGDHPRSRGVYSAARSFSRSGSGSSPLARGLRVGRRLDPPGTRIIPARAGFTRTIPAGDALPSDHPRSRGVYRSRILSRIAAGGSSPLARGLRKQVLPTPECGWIIPARAGFTRPRREQRPAAGDHPRSRGVYTGR